MWLSLLSVIWAQSQLDTVPDLSSFSIQDLKNRFKAVNYPETPVPNVKQCTMPAVRDYTVEPGYFSQSPNATATQCTLGFWCPGDTFQPFYCCDGYYCKTPSEIAICGQNKYCPKGSIEEQNCWFLAYCPIGTASPYRYGVLVVILVALIFVSFGFSIKNRLDIQKAVKNRLLVEMAIQAKSNSKAKINTTNQKSLDIEFDNLEYKLSDGSVIMKNVSGFFRTGKMTAIMGPSGAGKSTLFSLLTGKVAKSKGSILLNGKKEDLSKYKKLIGYIPQDDIMLRELTVNNILSHSAKMRLPTSLSNKQIQQKVIETIEYLGLGQVINTVVGDEETRGISGGQRKRVNIGMEIVADPSVLFLDEPTSGLDSSTSLEVCEILNRLAVNNSMTIAAIVHSPSPKTFAMFSDVLFLGRGGQVVYFGPTKGVSHYFRELGFESNDDSPSDFAMDVISGRIHCNYDDDFRPADLVEYWKSYQDGTPLKKICGRSKSIRRPNRESSSLNKLFTSIFTIVDDSLSWSLDVLSELVGTIIGIMRMVTFVNDPVRNTPNSFFQYFLLLKRAFQQQFRSKKRFIFDSIIHFVAGTIVSVAIKNFIYLGKNPKEVCQIAPFQLQFTCNSPVDFLNQAGMLLCVGIFFAGQTTASYTFGNEKVVFWRDTSSGMPTLSYFLAKFTADIPRMVIASFFYTTGIIVFYDYRSKFIVLMGVVLCLYFVAFQMGYLLSILLNKSSVGLVATANGLLWGFLFGGASPDLTSVMTSAGYSQIRWLWSISAPRYGIEAFYIIEVQNRQWQELLEDKWSHTYSRYNFQSSIVAMLLIGAFWALLSFLSLKLTNRRRQK